MATNELNKLKKSRSCIRGLFTRKENQLQGVSDLRNLPDYEISTEFQNIQDLRNRYEECQTNIEYLTEEVNLEGEVQNRFEFEEMFTRISNILNKMKRTTTTFDSNSIQGNNTQETHYRPLKIQFQPFQSNSETFKNFIRRLELYIDLNQVTNTNTKTQVLLSMLTPELHEKAYDLCAPDDPKTKTFEYLSKIIDEYIDPTPGPYALQHKFISRLQKEYETIPIYAATLRKLTSNCGFKCNSCQKSIADNFLCLQFIRGIKDSDIRIKLLQNKETSTFTEIVQTATVLEMGKFDNETISNNNQPSNEPTYQMTTSTRKTNTNTTKQQRNTSKYIKIRQLQGKCFRCGKGDHIATDCGMINETCYKCLKRGHLAKVCLQRNKDTNQLDEPSSDEDNAAEINLIKTETTEKYMITVEIENRPLRMEFDTGAALTSISMDTYKKLDIKNKIYKTQVTMRTYTNELIKPRGAAYVTVKYKNQTFNGKIYIIDKPVDPIFGRSWMKDLKLDIANINRVQIEELPKLDELLKEYESTVFQSSLGKIPDFQAHITLKENSQPIFIKPRRIPYALKKKVDDEIERLCTEGVITKIEHSEWGTPIVPVVKPNGSIRLCADYKITLNKVIQNEQYPIPIIEDIFAEMNGGEIYCTLDISQAYLNMEMDEQSALLQTLSTHRGTFKVNRLMFGVKVAPNLWQKYMDRLLQGIDGVKCFFDDIIIQGSTEYQLLQRLRTVLEKLKESKNSITKDITIFPPLIHSGQKSILYS